MGRPKFPVLDKKKKGIPWYTNLFGITEVVYHKKVYHARAHPKMLPLIPNLSRPVPVVIRCAAFQFQFVTELVRSDLALIA